MSRLFVSASVGWVISACLPSPVEDDSLALGPCDAASARAARPAVPAAQAVSDVGARVSESFPNGSAECAACIQSECSGLLARCANEADCVAFTACRWRDNAPSPASELRCGSEIGASLEEPLSAVRDLNNCWQTSCVDACLLGTQWSCAGAYSLPAPESSTVRVTQVLQQVTSDRPVCGARVRFCGPATAPADCESENDGEAVTDAAGMARAEVTIATDYRVGWSGYRQVVQPDQFSVRLQSNIAVTHDRFMLQHISTIGETSLIASAFAADLSRGNVVFQVFDCAHTGAEGVVLEVAGDPPEAVVADADTQIRYQRGRSIRLVSGATSATGDGGGAITNLIPDTWVWVTARRQDTRAVVAEAQIRTIPGELLLLELHPYPEVR